MAKKKQLTDIEKAYQKARKSLQSKVNRESKKGYFVDVDYIPKVPKKITQGSVRKLEKLSKDFVNKSEYVDFETGDIYSGKYAKLHKMSNTPQKPKKLTKEEIAEIKREERLAYLDKKGAESARESLNTETPNFEPFPFESEMVIQNFRSNVISRFPENAGPVLERWLDNIIAQQGEEAVAQMLQDAQDAGVVIDYKVAYSNELLMGAISDMMDYMPDLGQMEREDILDSLEMEEDWENPY